MNSLHLMFYKFPPTLNVVILTPRYFRGVRKPKGLSKVRYMLITTILVLFGNEDQEGNVLRFDFFKAEVDPPQSVYLAVLTIAVNQENESIGIGHQVTM